MDTLLSRNRFVTWLASLLALAHLALAQTVPPFASGAWSGNVTPTSATVCIRLLAPGLRVRLVVSPNPTLVPATFSNAETTNATAGNVVSLDVDGLRPDTDYYYGFEVAGIVRTEANSRGRFRTFPLGAASFKIAFAACGDFRDPDQRAFDAIRAEQPLLFIHTGDLHYADTKSTIQDDYRHIYDLVLREPTASALYRSVPIAYMWDDHDFSGGDNGHGTAPGTAAARAAYRQYVPHYPIAAAGGTMAQSFSIGRVRMIMTDTRSASSDPLLPETPTKTRLGAAQKAWFKQELISARDAGFPLILWVNPVPWIEPAELGADTWAGYATERTELANFIRDNRIRNLAMLSGDMHALAYDDGTHSDYATGGGAPLVVLQAASLTREANTKGGPYTAGPFPGSPQYGVLEITDNGGTTIQARFTGKKVGVGAKLEFHFNASAATIETRSIAAGEISGDRALANISALGRIATPGGTMTAGFAVSGRTARTILLRAVGPSLTAFNQPDGIPLPEFTLYQGGTPIASNDNWAALDVRSLNDAFDRAGAFRLTNPTPARHDAAMTVTLQPGNYTLQAKSQNGAVGSIMVEIYDVQ